MEEDNKPRKTVSTTFNMRTDLRSKAKVYIAMMNQKIEEKELDAEKVNMGILLNKAVEQYLNEIEIN